MQFFHTNEFVLLSGLIWTFIIVTCTDNALQIQQIY